MLYVTDTHPLVYFSTGKTRKLGKQARRAFQEAERNGRGSTSLDGLVIDVPVVKRAWALLGGVAGP